MTGDLSSLTERIRKKLAQMPIFERRMFGGITFMLNGNMLCCASNKGLMVRVGKEAEPGALVSPHAHPCPGTGRRMPGFILVDSKGLARDKDLAKWLGMARAYVETLPAKPLGKTESRRVKKSNNVEMKRGV